MKYLITGGTGSFGKKFVQYLAQNTGHEIIVFSRDELKQWEMEKTFPEVHFIIGDIRDKESIFKAVKGCDIIIHAAALKHVRTGEVQPWETIQTNVIGTKNVVDAANSVDAKMVLLSTDKAVLPINLYGASKMVAEKITIKGGQRVTRWGNVFGSSGSILHIFKNQAATGNRFTITDRRMTRFIITFEECFDVVNRAVKAEPGTIVIPKNLRAIKITDLAYAFDHDAKFSEIGIQPGEKLSEVLSLEPFTESEDCDKMSIGEIRRLIDESI